MTSRSLQAEFSTTQLLDRPVAACFFERMIRENLDLGSPEEIRASRPASLSGPTALNYLANGLSMLGRRREGVDRKYRKPKRRSPFMATIALSHLVRSARTRSRAMGVAASTVRQSYMQSSVLLVASKAARLDDALDRARAC